MKKIVLILCICGVLLGCDGYRAKKIFDQAQKLEQQHEFETAAEKYELIINNFPRTEFVEQARAHRTSCKEIINSKNTLINEAETFIKNNNLSDGIKKLEEVQQLGLPEAENKQIDEKLISLRVQRANELYTGKTESGKKVKKSYKQAFMLYQKAADAGDAYAQYSTAWMNEFGQGTVKNKNQALKYYELAAAQGHEEAAKQAQGLKALQELENITKDRKNIWLSSWLKATQQSVYSKYGNRPNYIDNNSEGNPCFIYGSGSTYGVIAHTVAFCFQNMDSSKEKKVYIVREYFPHITGQNDYPTLSSKIPASFTKIPKKHIKTTQEYPYQVTTYQISDEIWKVRYYEGTERVYDVNSGEYKEKPTKYITMLEVRLDL